MNVSRKKVEISTAIIRNIIYNLFKGNKIMYIITSLRKGSKIYWSGFNWVSDINLAMKYSTELLAMLANSYAYGVIEFYAIQSS